MFTSKIGISKETKLFTGYKFIRILFCFLFSLFIFTPLKADAATTTNKLRYKNYTTGKNQTYKGKLPNITIDGVKIQMKENPAIILDDVSYVGANLIFRDIIGAECKYSRNQNCLTISYNNHIMKLYPGKTECSLDDETLITPGTPFRIKYKASGYIDTMIPARFAAICLGIEYDCDLQRENITINTPFIITINDEYRNYTGSKAKMTIDGKKVNLTGTPSLILQDNCVFCARKEVFKASGIKYTYNKKTGEIILSRNGKTIYGCVGSSITYIDGILTYSPYPFSRITYENKGKSYIYLPGRFVFENLGFEYEWVEAEKTSKITDVTGYNNDQPEQNDSSEDNSIDYSKHPGLINVINPSDGFKYYQNTENCGQYISLPIPEKITAEDIKVNDLFMERKLQFVIPGDYSEFYSDISFINTGDCILQIRIYYNSSENTTEINFYSSFILDYKFLESHDKAFLELYIDYTKNINKKVIVLDAGHGGYDSGAVGGGIHESDLNLKIVNYAADYLKNSKIKVYCTRNTDIFYSLGERAALSEIVGADMFISVHHNSSSNSSAKGTSIYYSTIDTTESLNGLTSEALADAFLKNLVEKLETIDRGVIAENFVVVRDSKAPAVLLEIGFISSPEERKRLVKDSFSKKAARVIRDTVKQMYKEYK